MFTRDLVVAKRRPVVVWIHGGSFSRFKIVLALTFFYDSITCVLLVKDP